MDMSCMWTRECTMGINVFLYATNAFCPYTLLVYNTQ